MSKDLELEKLKEIITNRDDYHKLKKMILDLQEEVKQLQDEIFYISEIMSKEI